ncbi:M14 family zinc carboxypeptidase [Petrocella sp. FN5]|uniref:M14 family zinc carboxypeptidase n=1 Tax=Petrocella sp. FN5 TaxID=3032002 RepID=UPI0023DB8DC1|nr:M14 family zinc carboxypeptidase [Petrocella sp. FN5]MDF1616424.1 M14 family zinc carboxypeptidase [Petrocella sp. FN5]
MNRSDCLKRILNILLVLFLGVMMKQEISGAEMTFIELEKGSAYTYDQLHEIAIELSEAYPQILQYEYLVESFDQRSIFALIMTENETYLEPNLIYGERMHYMVDAGLHAREDVNPILVLKMIEDYAKAYMNHEKIQGIDLREVLGRSVFHFLPVTNPDGFELARRGLEAVRTEQARIALNQVSGVFVDQWDIYKDNTLYKSQPSSAFYAGSRAGSELETVILMDYILRYDFRNFITMHSRGEVVFWDNPNMPERFRLRAKALAKEIDTFIGYEMGQPKTAVQMTGYASDFAAAMTLKPMITVESLPITTQLPTPQALYSNTYEKVKIIPLLAERVGRRTGYLEYRLYVEDHYVRDFDDRAYAIAHSIKSEGIIVKDEGKPILYIGDHAIRKEGNLYLLSTHYPVQTSEATSEETDDKRPEELSPDTEDINEEATFERIYYEGYPVIHIKVEEERVVGDVPAILLNNRTMVPLRVIGEALGVDITWDQSTYTVSLTK